MNLPSGEYWMYLRKSRADIESEARGEGETLAKHRNALFKLAREYDINITNVFSEIESGESIFHRPEMVKMLRALEEQPPKGVLVMDIDRLGRGDKIDQGIIERAFKESRTLIVTPSEIYDMNQESGEFSVEVRSFLARMELKQTTKRLQGGRVRSVEDGNYIGTRPPYGYQIHKTDKGRFLVPDPDQSPIVRLIFERYTNARMGSNKIANELNSMGVKSYSGKPWSSSSVLTVLKNAVYAGRIQWKKKEQKKSKEPGKKRDTRTRHITEWIDVKGKHEPLVTNEAYERAQEILKRKYHVPYQLENGITNPLAGLIRCDMCGASMVYRPYTTQPAHLKCYNQLCANKSSRFEYVEAALLNALEKWIAEYKAQWGKRRKKDDSSIFDLKHTLIRQLERELNDLHQQKGNLHEFLEKKIYTIDVYLERSKVLADRIEEKQKQIEDTKKELLLEERRVKSHDLLIPQVERVLKVYQKSKDAAKKNELLKTILNYAAYRKEKHQRNDDFLLKIFPIIPK